MSSLSAVTQVIGKSFFPQKPCVRELSSPLPRASAKGEWNGACCRWQETTCKRNYFLFISTFSSLGGIPAAVLPRSSVLLASKWRSEANVPPWNDRLRDMSQCPLQVDGAKWLSLVNGALSLPIRSLLSQPPSRPRQMQSMRAASFPRGCYKHLRERVKGEKVSFALQFESWEGVGEWLLMWEFVAGSKEKMYLSTQERCSLQRHASCVRHPLLQAHLSRLPPLLKCCTIHSEKHSKRELVRHMLDWNLSGVSKSLKISKSLFGPTLGIWTTRQRVGL